MEAIFLKFTKVFKDELDHCYAIMRLKHADQDFLVVASEEKQPCYAYDLNNDYARTVVWPDVGGTMTMVQIPGTLNFLATQRFYPGFNSATCRIVKETFNGRGWDQTIVGDFPYVHRFDLLTKPNEAGYWYVGCTIANSKKDIDDWSDPGKVWVGDYDDSQEQVSNLRALDFRLTKNHGYKRMDGYALITGVQGIFKLVPPAATHDWQLLQLSTTETSDIFSADINQDGQPEYLTIEGFHGPYLRISDHNFKTITKSAADTPFGHAIWGGRLGDRDYFIFGWRSGKQDLELITSDHLATQLIDEQVGPSNVTVYEKDGQTYLLSANREANQVAVYAIDLE
ncbi:hypothetical protein FC61_GL001374 [Levilactobacillus brevis ATCC 14869 = DSM 20054]|uniref:FG-GAP repeat protein n=1 Tax=Levilactobacillus brevis ATCC 14869 = DSM 20054 TaxID=649758 RepID=U2P372_LEVBR|nr:hypothetical protein HMPREF0495_00567 [Levilactobacillus brevis ATCC 14869 = DSM 20054]KRK20590.1 hypothetical protein FC61_GL001374 [Levilactobacillus brevis ATCC 14869 = DSM 20054]